jgi:hypothetical protein
MFVACVLSCPMLSTFRGSSAFPSCKHAYMPAYFSPARTYHDGLWTYPYPPVIVSKGMHNQALTCLNARRDGTMRFHSERDSHRSQAPFRRVVKQSFELSPRWRLKPRKIRGRRSCSACWRIPERLYEDTSHGYLYTSRERCHNLLTYMSINKCA